MDPIRTAILGYGRNGSTMHAGAVERSPRFVMSAVCDIETDRRSQAAERFGCPVYADYAKMLTAGGLDLVVIVTRSDQHCRMACDCLRAGLHVLVSKPWAVDGAEARQMMDAAEESGRLLLPWLPSRWGSVYRRLREITESGAIGNLFLVRRTETSFNTRCDWQTERRYGGGYLLNWGPHIVDPALLIAGSPVRSVYGRLKQTINPGDAEDVFLAVLQTEAGTLVTAEYTVATDAFPTWVLQGDRGTVTVHRNRMRISRHSPARPEDPTRYSSMKAGEAEVTDEEIAGEIFGDTDEVYADIATAIRDGKAADYAAPATAALRLSDVLYAIRQSSDEDRVIRL